MVNKSIKRFIVHSTIDSTPNFIPQNKLGASLADIQSMTEHFPMPNDVTMDSQEYLVKMYLINDLTARRLTLKALN